MLEHGWRRVCGMARGSQFSGNFSSWWTARLPLRTSTGHWRFGPGGRRSTPESGRRYEGADGSLCVCAGWTQRYTQSYGNAENEEQQRQQLGSSRVAAAIKRVDGGASESATSEFCKTSPGASAGRPPVVADRFSGFPRTQRSMGIRRMHVLCVASRCVCAVRVKVHSAIQRPLTTRTAAAPVARAARAGLVLCSLLPAGWRYTKPASESEMRREQKPRPQRHRQRCPSSARVSSERRNERSFFRATMAHFNGQRPKRSANASAEFGALQPGPRRSPAGTRTLFTFLVCALLHAQR